MYSVLAFLRTIICSGVAFVVWYILVNALQAPNTVMGALLPVWVAGFVGGVISAVFNARQGIMLAFTCGVLLMIGFLFVRHGLADIPLTGNTIIVLWPVWFPPAFYVGAYGYILMIAGRRSH